MSFFSSFTLFRFSAVSASAAATLLQHLRIFYFILHNFYGTDTRFIRFQFNNILLHWSLLLLLSSSNFFLDFVALDSFIYFFIFFILVSKKKQFCFACGRNIFSISFLLHILVLYVARLID